MMAFWGGFMPLNNSLCRDSSAALGWAVAHACALADGPGIHIVWPVVLWAHGLSADARNHLTAPK